MTTKSGINRFNNNGQALVEFAIILPLLMLLVFGIIEFGRFLYLKNSVTNAAREGARLAAVTKPYDAATVTNYVISLPDMNNATVTAPATASFGNPVVVIVSKPFRSVVPDIIPQFKNLTSIRASATMRYE